MAMLKAAKDAVSGMRTWNENLEPEEFIATVKLSGVVLEQVRKVILDHSFALLEVFDSATTISPKRASRDRRS